MISAKTNSTSYPLSDTRPLAIELYAGLYGWGEGFASEGYRCIGYDIVDMCELLGMPRPAGCELILQDVRTLHGSQFKDAAVIVASPPCQAYSYRAMPWKRAKALPPPDNTLFEQPFRIQREASEAAGRHIPLIVENVRGAQKWVGRAQCNYKSFYLWGDIPALMPKPGKGFKGFKGFKREWRDCEASRSWSSKSAKRKEWSAQIAKIPFPLAQHIARVFKPVATSLLLLLAFSSPRKVVMDDACTSRQLSLNFNITEEHVPTADLYNFATPVRDLPAQPNSEVTSQPVLTLEPGALPPALDELAKKYRPFIDRVLTRLSEAERKEVNTHLQQDIRQAWITVSYAQRMSDAFVQASYAIYGKHPDHIWPSIVANRKALLGAEYHDWYDSNDMLRPDVPKIPPTSSAAILGGKAVAGAGSLPIAHRPAPDSDKEKIV